MPNDKIVAKQTKISEHKGQFMQLHATSIQLTSVHGNKSNQARSHDHEELLQNNVHEPVTSGEACLTRTFICPSIHLTVLVLFPEHWQGARHSTVFGAEDTVVSRLGVVSAFLKLVF